MKDQFGRDIDYLRLSVTDLCNLRCRYCMPETGVQKLSHNDILSIEELTEIARAAISCGIRKIRLTGGEPLVRKGLLTLCQNLSALEGLQDLGITTNGTLLPQLAAPLKEAGMQRLNISLDTLRPEKFTLITRCGDLKQVFSGIRAAEDAGFERIKINAILMKDFNDDEIVNFIELTREHPWEVRFIELMPMGQSLSVGSYLSGQAVLSACPQLKPLETDGVSCRYKIPGYAGFVGLITPMSHPFCNACNRIRVTADGRLKPCLHSDRELLLRGLTGNQLEQAIRNGILEKQAEHHLADYGITNTHRTMNQIGG